ncbi:methyltransferase domain-containing protein [Streptomyces sp. NPDC046275]|uniref:methyltransferase domain-containing protein n=1 Tax=Streptomyces sp. NPDC046275 TaxID=3157201 RepID=UPI003410F92A
MTRHSDATAGELRAKFAGDLGQGRTSEWLAAFASVPREVFTPSFWQQDAENQWREVTVGNPAYLKTVYSNVALTTQLDERGIPTSSSSEPGLMLAMLDALCAEAGHTVYELGTGTGYNAALLSWRLGDENVVTVDVDPVLTHLARMRLSRTQMHPTVLTADGAEGHKNRAPYDRIIATAGLRCLPPQLLDQASDGAVIVAPIGFGVAQVTVSGRGEAGGQFLSTPAYFMPRRAPSKPPAFAELETQEAERTEVPAEDVLDRLKFPLSLALPGYNSCSWRDGEGRITGVGLWTADGSTASVHVEGKVRQTGPQRLWDTVEELAKTFPDGTPARQEFGLTITPEAQRAWYRDPDGPSWALHPL